MAFNEQPSNPAAAEADASTGAGDAANARQLIDESRRHFALKEYAQAIDKVAQALEQLSSHHAEDADELAPVLHLYGRSLLENFIINSAALGGGGGSAPLPSPSAPTKSAAVESAPAAGGSSKPSTSNAASSSSASATADPRFSFSGDAEDDDEDDEGAAAAGANEDDDDDDLQVAFSVLDLARVIYERILTADKPELTTLEAQQWGKTRIQAELAEVLNHLGDVGLEAENFAQASADYEASLQMLEPLLRAHSRRLADAHLRLGLALEFHPDIDQRKRAKQHVQSASQVLASRIAAIQARIDNPSSADAKEEEGKERDDLVELDAAALKTELEDVSGMKREIDTKLDEYDTEDGQAQLSGQPDLAGVLGLPAEATAAAGMTTKDALQQAIKDAFLGASADDNDVNPFTGAKTAASDAPVNNLSSMVKRKKKDDSQEADKKQRTEP
ncbi:NASP family CENP-A chaperone [Moesziomyces antarcticus]|uniref:Uncharacterized protein n=2 Tax=Pseudozyma antarctica TaxID=84753 RepID=A0A5C3FMC2_PSEA2|nr:NASP family CENP-A chaperone [Moesziomyces antarcticus]GAK64565.1 NASP family CENP-A chaperone [Moesziomyces antarcticus]SPO44925.1 uncharacterized protein PSANT_02611 [Moesziomyces antarcticus]